MPFKGLLILFWSTRLQFLGVDRLSLYYITHQKNKTFDLPKDVGRLVGKDMNLMGKPKLTPDMIELRSEGFLPSMTLDYDTMKDFGIKATYMEMTAFDCFQLVPSPNQRG